jgi:hypothetical protein
MAGELPDAATAAKIKRRQIDCLACIAALGFGDIPPGMLRGRGRRGGGAGGRCGEARMRSPAGAP